MFDSARRYDPVAAGVAADLRLRLGPIEPVLSRIDPLLATPIALSAGEFNDLVSFVRGGLLDYGARPRELCSLVPLFVPSGMPMRQFEGCKPRRLTSSEAAIDRSFVVPCLARGDRGNEC